MYKNITLTLLFISQLLIAQDLPMGFTKYFEANFTKENKDKVFLSSEQCSFKLSNDILNVKDVPDTADLLIPPAVLLVDNHVLGDFIAEIDLNITAKQIDSLSGLFLIAGLRDSANYYFIQFNNAGASFYKMYRGEVSLINTDSTFIIKDQAWQKLRVTRDILKRSILFETKTQKTEFTDPNLVMGYFGIGIKNYKLTLKKFVVWAPTAISRSAPLFNKPVDK